MHILQIHNRYIHPGGEDFVIAQEKELLEQEGHRVSQYFADNKAINTALLKVKTAIKMPYNYEEKKKLLQHLSSLKPDVVHIHNVFPVLSPAVIDVVYELDIPIVVTLHNYRLLCINGLLYRNGEVCTKCIDTSLALPGILHGCYQESSIKSVFPAITNHIHSKRKTWQDKVSKFIILTEFTKTIFDKSYLKIPGNKIVIKSNFAPDQIPLFEKQDYFLFVGRLSEEKGIRTVVNAFIHTGDVLRIAGNGPLLPWLTQVSQNNGNIEVLGFQTQQQLKQLYANARALVYASKWYETFGLVIIEAFSFGTPVIAPDFGNAGIFIEEGLNGLKYKINSLDHLIKTIDEFKQNSDEERLRQGARQSYLKNFTPQHNLKALEDIYLSVLPSPIA